MPKAMIGGSPETASKKENGARFCTPLASMLTTHAIGRGTITECISLFQVEHLGAIQMRRGEHDALGHRVGTRRAALNRGADTGLERVQPGGVLGQMVGDTDRLRLCTVKARRRQPDPLNDQRRPRKVTPRMSGRLRRTSATDRPVTRNDIANTVHWMWNRVVDTREGRALLEILVASRCDPALRGRISSKFSHWNHEINARLIESYDIPHLDPTAPGEICDDLAHLHARAEYTAPVRRG